MGIGNYFKKKTILKYNGKEYQLKPGDIPDLEGHGTIVIDNRKGQYQSTKGTLTNVHLYQDGKKQSINGIDLGKLIKKLEERK